MPNREKASTKLNDLDAKILKILLKDGRMGYDELAEECKVNRNVAWKRCNAMKKKGIIRGATVQTNLSHFGFDALATLLIGANAQQLKQVMEITEGIAQVHAYRQYNSVYNVRASAILRSLNELDQIKQTIRQRVPIIGLKTYIWTGVRNIPENLNFTSSMNHVDSYNQLDSDKAVNRPQTEAKTDKLDRQIVGELAMEGRASFAQIARKLGVTTDTVARRYHKLRERGSLKVAIQINPNKIGYSSILYFNIAFSAPGSFSNRVVESLMKIPDMTTIAKTSGDYDLEGTAMIRDIPESFAIQDQIARISGVMKVEAGEIRIPDKWPTPQQHISTF